MKRIDLSGQTFGRLKVLEYDEEASKNHSNGAYWKCQCECGNIKSVSSRYLRMGLTTSCGCYHSEIIKNDLTNQRFGKLIALHPTNKRFPGTQWVIWQCQCDCGNTIEVPSALLKNGNTKSCGCLNSIGELEISNILLKNNIKFEKEKQFLDLSYPGSNRHPRFDFYLPEQNRLIEFDGEQHFRIDQTNCWHCKQSLEERQEKDKIKNEYAKKNNIELVRIPYTIRHKITLETLLGSEYLIK